MHTSSFAFLRTSILAALGVGVLGCGGSVVVDVGGAGGGSGTSGTSGTSTGNTTVSTGTGIPSSVCAGAVPIMTTDGADSGFARCPDGTIHRVAVTSCNSKINSPACLGNEDSLSCTTDADCTAKPHGKCVHSEGGFDIPGTYCGCEYACENDSECDSGVCVCDGVVDAGKGHSFCAQSAACITGADCGSGECGITSFFDGCMYNVELACRSANDICRLDADCTGGGKCATVYGSGQWSCEFEGCAIGRPLLVEGRARTATPKARGDWSVESLDLDLAGLSPELREALAVHWQGAAALEHASIASFARFTLELLSLGAPPDLVADAQRAALDEVEHAKIAYALASAYAGRALGPSALDLQGLPIARDRREVVRSLIEEACVGETLGVAEARWLSDVVEDPALRDLLSRIADDEQRHAELAWRTLAWMLEGEGASLRSFAREVFDEAMEAMAAARLPKRMAARECGLLSASEIMAVRQKALAEVVGPCKEALLPS